MNREPLHPIELAEQAFEEGRRYGRFESETKEYGGWFASLLIGVFLGCVLQGMNGG